MSVSLESKFPLLDEIAISRQVKSENSTLQSINLMYKNQISALEVEISDLKALVTAKDYELKLLTEKDLNKSIFGSQRFNLIPTQTPKENSSKYEDLDAKRVKLLLEKEKQVNKSLISKVQELKNYIEKLNQNQNHSACNSRISELEKQIEVTLEENESLRRKFLTPTFIEPEETTRDFSTHCLPIADFSSVSDDNPEILISHTPHRLTTNFQFDLREELKFNTSKAKTKSLCPKKSLTPAKVVRRFTCNLSEILNSAPSQSKPCKFYPSTLRKFKNLKPGLSLIN